MPLPPPVHKPKAETIKQFVTGQLRQQAFEGHDTLNEHGDPQTKGEALARLIWREALGWTEDKRNEDGNLVKVVHPPSMAMQEKLLDRLDGKIPMVAETAGGGIKAADKVRDLAKGRLNDMARKAMKKDA